MNRDRLVDNTGLLEQARGLEQAQNTEQKQITKQKQTTRQAWAGASQKAFTIAEGHAPACLDTTAAAACMGAAGPAEPVCIANSFR